MRSLTNGPLVVTGNTNPIANMDSENGPSLIFQGDHLYDPRYAGNSGAAPGLPGTRDHGIAAFSYNANVNGIPQALSTTRIAAAQAAASGVAFTLVSAQAVGVSPNIPIQPWSSGRPTKPDVTTKVNTLALDFGMTTCTVVSGTATVSALPAGTWQYFQQPGQKVIISGAGSASNQPLIAGILTPPAVNGTTMTLDTNAGQSASALQIGTANPTGLVAWPYLSAGTGVALADPTQLIARAVSITGSASATGGNVTVVGYDVWGNPQSEVIAAPASATTVNGKKAFKFIVSVTPAFTDAGHTYSVGTTDIFGFTLRNDLFETAEIYWNGAFITSATGWLTADGATPTTTTGDTRGTYAVQSASDGAKRLILNSALQLSALANANNLNVDTLFGRIPV